MARRIESAARSTFVLYWPSWRIRVESVPYTAVVPSPIYSIIYLNSGEFSRRREFHIDKYVRRYIIEPRGLNEAPCVLGAPRGEAWVQHVNRRRRRFTRRGHPAKRVCHTAAAAASPGRKSPCGRRSRPRAR